MPNHKCGPTVVSGGAVYSGGVQASYAVETPSDVAGCELCTERGRRCLLSLRSVRGHRRLRGLVINICVGAPATVTRGTNSGAPSTDVTGDRDLLLDAVYSKERYTISARSTRGVVS